MGEIWRDHALMTFWTAQSISALGDAFRRFTLVLWVFQATGGSGLAVAAVTAAELAPYLVLGLVGGALVDRWPVKTVLLVCDLARAVVGLGLVAAAWTGAVGPGILLMVVMTVFSLFSDLASNVAFTQLVENRHLERVNALWTVSQQLALIGGPVLAAVCFARLGPVPALAIDAATFLVSFFLLLASFRKHTIQPVGVAVLTPKRSLRGEIREGWQYVWSHRLIRAITVAGTLQVVSAGINSTVMLFFLTQDLGHAPTDVAWLGTVNGIAQVLAGGTIMVFTQRIALGHVLAVGSGLMTVGAIVVAGAPNLAVLVLGVVITSLGNSPMNIGRSTLEQRFVVAGLLGRVRSVSETASTMLFLGSATAAGAVVNGVGARSLLILSAAFMALSLFTTAFSVLGRLHAVSSPLTDRPSE